MTAARTAGFRWGDVVLSAVAAVSWAFLAMAGVAALGLHLLGADSAASLGPLTAAAVVLAVGGSVTPSGDVSAFGLDGQAARSAVDLAPLGVGLAGALVLGWVFARSLRRAGATVGWGELTARIGATAGLFVALLAFLAWAGHDTVTIDGKTLAGLGGLIGGGGGGSGGGSGDGGLLDRLRDGLGDLGIGDGGDDSGGLPGQVADLIGAEASVGFAVDTGASLAGGAVWVLEVLVITVLAARRAPLPRALEAAHRFVRPAASALVTVALVAVAAGLAAAGYAAVGDDHPGRVLGAALLAAPNGVWLGLPLGLFVPWHGSASGVLTRFLPDPVDRLLDGRNDIQLTVGRLAELDGRVWLLPVAAALLMLLAGVLTAVRTPREGTRTLPFALRCAAGLGGLTALTLPLWVHLTGVSANASLSVFGFDAFGAGLELRGSVPAAFALGAVWGAAAGLVGGLLACATGAAGRRAVRLPGDTELSGDAGGRGARTHESRTHESRTQDSRTYDPRTQDSRMQDARVQDYGRTRDYGRMHGRTQDHGHPGGPQDYPDAAYRPGPYTPSPAYRPPHADTNPYMRPPQEPKPRGASPDGPPPSGEPPRRQSWPTPPPGPLPETQTWPPPPERPPHARDWNPPPAGHAAPTARRPGSRPPEAPPPPESHPTVGDGHRPPPPPRPPVPPKPRGTPRQRPEGTPERPPEGPPQEPPQGPPPPGQPGEGR
ncbi:streptophobe family protein [Streptomyces chrestomyceticus]|uniref:streptophobe family protein n=1 Tax=Streptomyces chrestomyceticus TaxID=68185 RepID=UPI0035A89779